MNVLTGEEKLSTSQRGRIAELQVATALMAQSNGRLSPFEPFSDDHGVDLVVLDKITGQALTIQVKAWFLMPDKPVKTVQFDLQKSTYSDDHFGAVVCVVIDPEILTIKVGWVIPSLDIPKLATSQKFKFAMVPSRMATSKDKYTPYRHHSISALCQAITELISRA